MARSSLITELVLNDSFRSLDEATLASLESELESVQLSSGEILFRQGDPGDSMFVLVRGTLAVSLNTAEGKEIVVGNESEPGTTIGEMALVTGQERMVTVRVLNDAELIKLSKAGFNTLAEKEPLVAAELAKITAGRWQQAQLAVALSNLLGDVNPALLNPVQTTL
jgi:CRP-like cAMP-binding protein